MATIANYRDEMDPSTVAQRRASSRNAGRVGLDSSLALRFRPSLGQARPARPAIHRNRVRRQR